MPAPLTQARLIAEALCKKYPTHSTLGLAKKLANDHPECFKVETARSMVRVIRGANGKHQRSYATQTRKKGKAGEVPAKPPKSIAESWQPFDLGSGIKVAVISDVHIPYHSEIAFETAVKDLKQRKPDVLLINGDFADFYTVSRWQKDPRKRRMSEELKIVMEGLTWLRQEFGKNCRIVYKYGNHEERWDHFIWNRAPEVYDLPQCQIHNLLEFERLGIEYVDEQRFVMAGKLPIAHGHELPKGMGLSPVNMARGVFLRTIHTMLVGHGHRTSGHAESNVWHDEVFCWSTGCLCDMSPEYARVNKWNWGYAFVEVGKDGSFDVDNLRISKRGEVRGS